MKSRSRSFLASHFAGKKKRQRPSPGSATNRPRPRAGELLEQRVMLDGGGFGFPGRSYELGDHPTDMAAADFDGDGHVDLVTANGGVTVLLNQGDGTFSPQALYEFGGVASSVAAADFDGDGRVDLVTAQFQYDNVWVMRNQGNGTFASQVAYSVGDGPRGVAAADLDGDGLVDLVTANSNAGTVSVLRNLGDGTFAPQVTYAVGISPSSVAAADFDGDGRFDLVAANGNSKTVSVLQNQGDGTFATQVTYFVDNNPRSVTAADFDGDGRVDLVTANGGSGGYGTVSVLRNQGDGTFSPQVIYAVDGGPTSVTAADVDGDGRIDLVTANSDYNTASVLRNQGDGTFAPQMIYAVGGDPESVAVADVDGDGHVDLVFAIWNIGIVSVLRNEGDGTFAAQVAYAVGAEPYSVTSADFDGDGDVDLATANRYSSSVSVLWNEGDGTFALPDYYVVGTSPWSLTAADLDGDGHIDLIAANYTSGTVSVLRNAGSGNFAAQVTYAVGGFTRSVAAADFDGDGHVDLVTANWYYNTVSVLRNQGDGTFSPQVIYAVDGGPTSVTAADVDGDGRIDLVTANYNTVSVLRNQGDGTFAPQMIYAVGGDTESVAVADVDGDGRLDLVTANSDYNTVSVLRNRGDGTFAPHVMYAVGSFPQSVTAADFDGDGYVDVVTGNVASSTVSVLRNQGDGTFSPQVIYASGSSPRSVAAADFDGDGRVDLVTANSGADSVSVLRNFSPQNIGGTSTDLVVDIVSVDPAAVQIGQTLQIEYEVRNVGQDTAAGHWSDSIYLSRDNKFDASDVLLARVTHEGGLAAIGGYTQTLEVSIPFFAGFVPGEWHVLVRTDAGYRVPEVDDSNNSGVSASINIQQQVTALELGVPVAGQISAGESLYFEVDFAAGDPLAFRLTGLPTDGTVELSIKRDGLPTGAVFDRASRGPFATDQSIYLPAQAETGTFYILVHAPTLASSSTSFELTAFVPEFSVLTNSFGNAAGNGGHHTLRAFGAGFDLTTRARLINGQGFELAATSQFVDDPTRFYATFDLRGVAPGTYDVVFTNAAEVTITVPRSLTVVAAPGVDDVDAVIPRLIVPSAIRRGVPYSFTVEWENTSLNDVYAPLLLVGNSVPFGMSFTDRDSLGTRYTFLGISTQGGPAGILRSGQRESITFWSASGLEDGRYTAFVDRVVKDASAPFDWNEAKGFARPFYLSEEEFEPIFQQLVSQVGLTGGDYLAMLSRNASLLPNELGSPHDVRDLLRLEADFARAAIQTSISGVVTTAESTIQIPGTTLTAHNRDTGEQFSAIVLNDGRFVFPEVTPGTYEFTCDDAIVQATAPVMVATNDHLQGVTLEAQRGAIISGKVTATSGNPIAGASLAIRRVGGTSLPSVVVTDGEGNFRLANLPAAEYSIEVRAQGYIGRLITPVIADVDAPAIADIVLTNGGQQIIEIRDDVTGLPVDDVIVSLTNSVGLPDGLPIGAFSDTNGLLTLDGFAPGSYRLVFAKTGYPQQSQVAQLSGEPLTITLHPGVAVFGHLVDAGGNPLAGISVSLSSASGDLGTSTTSAGGGFGFDSVVPGNYTLSVLSSGVVVYQQPITVDGGPADVIAVAMPVAAKVQGQARNSDGTPLQSGDIVLTDVDGNTVLVSPLALDGSFDLFVLTPGQYGLAIRSTLGLSEVTSITAPSIGSPTLDVSLTLGSYAVEGRLVDELGQPLAEATVFLSHSNGGFANPVVTDLDGNFSFPGVPAGTVRVSATSSLRIWKLEVALSDQSVELGHLLPQIQTPITVAVTDSLGASVIGAIVILEQGGIAIDSTLVDEDGVATLYGVSGSTYKLRVVTSRYAVKVVDGVQLGDNGVVILSQTPTIAAGQVVHGSADAPIGGATVFAYNESGDLVGVVDTDEDGSFTFHSLPSTEILLRAEAAGFLVSSTVVIDLTSTLVVDGVSVALQPAVVVSINQPAPLAALSIEDLGLSENPTIGWFLNYANSLNLPVAPKIPGPAECEAQAAALRQIIDAKNETANAERELIKIDDLYGQYVQWGVALGFTTLAEFAVSFTRFQYQLGAALAGLASDVVLSPATRLAISNLAKEVTGYLSTVIDKAEGFVAGEVSLSDTIQTLTGVTGALIEIPAAVIELENKASEDARAARGLTPTEFNPNPTITDGVARYNAVRLAGRVLSAISTALELVSTTEKVLGIVREIDRANNKLLSVARTFEAAFEKLETLIDKFADIDCDDDEEPDDPPDDEGDTERPASWDPNDIIGPAGVGPANHIVAGSLMPYTIRFENDAEQATAPAAMVTISQTLDADLDWTTFRLGDLGIGSVVIDVPEDTVFFTTRYDATATLGVYVDIEAGINAATGEVRWQFVAVDPETGDLPEDPFVGFLPPNVDSPEGEGFVTYTVRPKSGAGTGTVINAEARIVFDVNEPIDTPPIFHTLDAGQPTSSVNPQPAVYAGNIVPVSWSGTDDQGGSGIASFDIFVSIDGGQFQLWLANVTEYSHLFTGDYGHSYAFYSVARDFVGHREMAPLSPDTVTALVEPARVIDLRVRSSVWTDGDGPGYSVPVGPLDQLKPLGWHNLDQIRIAFSKDVLVDAADLRVTGIGVAEYPIGSFSYDPTTFTGTWTLTQTIGADRLVVTLDVDSEFGVTDAAGGLPVDGNWADGLSSYASGDGMQGGDFNFAFNVIPGDANQDGRVDGDDYTIWAEKFLLGGQVLFLGGDFTGDGTVDGADYTVWADNYSKTLPDPASAWQSTATSQPEPAQVNRSVTHAFEALSAEPLEAALPLAALAATDGAFKTFDHELPSNDIGEFTYLGWPAQADVMQPAELRFDKHRAGMTGATRFDELPPSLFAWSAHQIATDQVLSEDDQVLTSVTAMKMARPRFRRTRDAR